MKARVLLFLLLIATLAIIPARAQDTGKYTYIAKRISPAYSLTGTGFGSANRITKPGTIYTVRIDGLFARAVNNGLTPANTIKDGALINPVKGFWGAIGTAGDSQQVKVGQRFYLHEINAYDDNSVVFTFISTDMVSTVIQGRSGTSRLRFDLRFDLKKDVLTNLTAETIHNLTDPYFLPEGDPAATQTVQLGQSLEEVKKIMGEPVKVMDMGAKQILIYKDVKVTLVDGKVTDAQ